MKNLLRRNPVNSFLICGAMLLPTACGRAPIDLAEPFNRVTLPASGVEFQQFEQDESQVLDDTDEVNEIKTADSLRNLKRALPFPLKRLGRSKILKRLPTPFRPPLFDPSKLLKRSPGHIVPLQ